MAGCSSPACWRYSDYLLCLHNVQIKKKISHSPSIFLAILWPTYSLRFISIFFPFGWSIPIITIVPQCLLKNGRVPPISAVLIVLVLLYCVVFPVLALQFVAPMSRSLGCFLVVSLSVAPPPFYRTQRHLEGHLEWVGLKFPLFLSSYNTTCRVVDILWKEQTNFTQERHLDCDWLEI